MKNLTDLPEKTLGEISNKIRCYLSELNHMEASIKLLNARSFQIKEIIKRLIDKQAQIILKKHKITPARLRLF